MLANPPLQPTIGAADGATSVERSHALTGKVSSLRW
jgi:hypothetical protein